MCEYYTTCSCICSLRYPTCKAHETYCYPLLSRSIFFHGIPQTARLSVKKTLNTKRVFWHSLQRLLWNISHSKKKLARCDQICTLVFMYSAIYSCPILTKLEFSLENFEKSSNIKFHEAPLSHPRNTKLGGPQGRSEHSGEDTNFLHLPGVELFSASPTHSLT